MSRHPSRRDFLRAATAALAAFVAACRAPAPRTPQPTAPEIAPAPATAAVPATGGAPSPGQTADPATRPPATEPLPTPSIEYPAWIVRRSAWGAREPNLNAFEENGVFHPDSNPFGWEVWSPPLRGFLTTLVVHHTALPPSDGPREIQALHQDRRGWADVGYHFLISAEGTIYEGRYIYVRGRHTGGANSGTLGIVLLGNFEEIPEPPPGQLASLERLVAYLVEQFAVSFLAGHRDFNPNTLCPGEHLYPLVDAIAARQGLQHSTQGYEPPPWVVTMTPDRRR
jgi:hypothetical protein